MYTCVHDLYNCVMICPFCGSDTSVQISRSAKRTPAVWRRRLCEVCDRLFSSREKPDLSLSVSVLAPAGDSESFSEDKILLSVYECLSHRKKALSEARELTSTIENRLFPVAGGVIATDKITETIYRVLCNFDRTAAAVYRARYQKR